MLSSLQPNLIWLIPDKYTEPMSASCPFFQNDRKNPKLLRIELDTHYVNEFDEMQSPKTQVDISSPSRLQFLTHSQMMNMMDGGDFITGCETVNIYPPIEQSEPIILLRSDKLIQDSFLKDSFLKETSPSHHDDLCYSKSNFNYDKLSKVEENYEEENISSFSELDDLSLSPLQKVEAYGSLKMIIQHNLLDGLSLVQSQVSVDQFKKKIPKSNQLMIEKSNLELEKDNLNLSVIVQSCDLKILAMSEQLQIQEQKVTSLEIIILDRDNKINNYLKELNLTKRQILENQMQFQYESNQQEEKVQQLSQDKFSLELAEPQRELQNMNKIFAQLQERYKAEFNSKEEMLNQLQAENEGLRDQFDGIEMKCNMHLKMLRGQNHETIQVDKLLQPFILKFAGEQYSSEKDLMVKLQVIEQKFLDEMVHQEAVREKLQTENSNLQIDAQFMIKSTQNLELKKQEVNENVRKKLLDDLAQEVTSVKKLRQQLSRLVKQLGILPNDKQKHIKIQELTEQLNELKVQLLMEKQDKTHKIDLLQSTLMDANQREIQLQQCIKEKQICLVEQENIISMYKFKTDRNQDFILHSDKSIKDDNHGKSQKLLLEIRKLNLFGQSKSTTSLQTSPKVCNQEKEKTQTVVKKPLQAQHKKVNSMYQFYVTIRPDNIHSDKWTKNQFMDENIIKLVERFKGTQILQHKILNRYK